MSVEWAHLRLALKILHNIQKSIVNIWLVGELNLDLVKVAEGILLCTIISKCAPRQSPRSLVWVLSAIGTALVSHIEYGLLSLVHGAGSWAHGIARGDAAAERYGLRATSTNVGLERRSEDGCRAGGWTDGAIGRKRGMRTWGEHGMLCLL